MIKMNNLKNNIKDNYNQILATVADCLGCSIDYITERRQNVLDFKKEMRNLLDALSDEKLEQLYNYLEEMIPDVNV